MRARVPEAAVLNLAISAWAFAAVTIGESALEAEVKAMLRGSRMCLTLGIQNVIFESDSYIVWNSIVSELGMPWTLMPLWKKLRDSLDKIPSWHVLLTRRDANRDIYLQELCLQEERMMPLDQQTQGSSTLGQSSSVLRSTNEDTTEAEAVNVLNDTVMSEILF
ncbi:hypothetical protein CKAN_00486800 [Cinnamomum micranthum f. kanehirae]|uniref:RNase H type-1 domain-containing protein n=1 Tax=Cinnamomum micranthum f. kanehirae TaxID=337451 RepID=A0A3S3M3G6_9MAGN|nr:hypothetical protein CKAN_00486800 [Cinnamomum micranthum f. kanehirae]